MINSNRFFLTAAALLASLPAMAATVSLDPSTLSISPSGSFTVDVVMDASDVPGDHPALIQGNFEVTFDDSLVQYDSFSYVDSSLLIGPVVGAGSVAVGFTNGAEVGTIGTFSFTALGNPGDVISLNIGNQFVVSTFVNLLPVNTGFDPIYAGADVNVVPIPAAAWLMLSALGVLGARMRRLG